MRIKIEVTSEHIQKGMQNNYRSCPVALACSEQLKQEVHVGILSIHTDCTKEEGKVLMEPPTEEVKEFIIAFDDGRPVKPFSFELEVPEDMEIPNTQGDPQCPSLKKE